MPPNGTFGFVLDYIWFLSDSLAGDTISPEKSSTILHHKSVSLCNFHQIPKLGEGNVPILIARAMCIYFSRLLNMFCQPLS